MGWVDHVEVVDPSWFVEIDRITSSQGSGRVARRELKGDVLIVGTMDHELRHAKWKSTDRG